MDQFTCNLKPYYQDAKKYYKYILDTDTMGVEDRDDNLRLRNLSIQTYYQILYGYIGVHDWDELVKYLTLKLHFDYSSIEKLLTYCYGVFDDLFIDSLGTRISRDAIRFTPYLDHDVYHLIFFHRMSWRHGIHGNFPSFMYTPLYIGGSRYDR